MIQSNMHEQVRLDIRCLASDENKVIDLLLGNDVLVFDCWHCQRYGLPASHLNLVEQVRGYIRYSAFSCTIPHTKAIEIKHALHQQIAQGECLLFALLPCGESTQLNAIQDRYSD